MQFQKWQNDFDLFQRQTIQHHSNPNLCPTHWCSRSWNWMVLWRSTTPSRTNTKIICPFATGDWNAKIGSQEIPGVTGKFSPGVQNKAGPKQTEFCQENARIIANTLFWQHNRWLYTWTSPDGQYQNQIYYILCSQRWRISIQLEKSSLGADCGSHHELLIAKFRFKLKKEGKPLDHSGLT